MLAKQFKAGTLSCVPDGDSRRLRPWMPVHTVCMRLSGPSMYMAALTQAVGARPVHGAHSAVSYAVRQLVAAVKISGKAMLLHQRGSSSSSNKTGLGVRWMHLEASVMPLLRSQVVMPSILMT